MSPRNLLGVLALGCALTGSLTIDPATAHETHARKPLTFEAARSIRSHFSSLLPPYRLQNDTTSHYLHVKKTVTAVIDADYSMFGKEAGKVNFRKGWHPKAYSTAVENNGAYMLGTLCAFGHSTIVNANIPEMKEDAQAILKRLIKISEDTQLKDLSADLNSVLQAVSDGAFAGGPCAALEKFDDIAGRLCDRVEDVYLRDGFWFFTAGMTLGGLHAIPAKDWYNAPYFRDALSHLYNSYPSPGLSFEARNFMSRILRPHLFTHFCLEPTNDLAKQAMWAIYTFPGKV